jgi:hypothetical protein
VSLIFHTSWHVVPMISAVFTAFSARLSRVPIYLIAGFVVQLNLTNIKRTPALRLNGGGGGS